VLIISILLALAPLLGIAYIIWQDAILTVDSIFYTLILLAMSAIFGGNALYELTRGRRGRGSESGGRVEFGKAGPGTRTERGLVESVMFYESPVGYADKSIVTLRPNGSKSARMLPFEGDLRNQLPVGQYVELTYRSNGGNNQVVQLSYK
jgi:hypothetical protein